MPLLCFRFHLSFRAVQDWLAERRENLNPHSTAWQCFTLALGERTAQDFVWITANQALDRRKPSAGRYGG
jgi:hypothetical protein